MKIDASDKNYTERFRKNLRAVRDIYKKNKENNAKSYAQIYNKIVEYCNDNDIAECFSDSTFKKWLSGASPPRFE